MTKAENDTGADNSIPTNSNFPDTNMVVERGSNKKSVPNCKIPHSAICGSSSDQEIENKIAC